jgi:hypothetical protein
MTRSTLSRATCFVLAATLLAPSRTSSAETAEPTPEQETMSRLRALAGALLSRSIDEISGENRMGAPADDWILASKPSERVRVPNVRALRTRKGVLGLLRPSEDFIYLCDVPDRDAWGTRIEVYYQEEKLLSARFLTVRSAGANRQFDAQEYEVGGFLPGAEIDDIVIADKRFVRWPVGVPEAELEVHDRIGRCPGFEEEMRKSAAQSPAPAW